LLNERVNVDPNLRFLIPIGFISWFSVSGAFLNERASA
jgi:hypothetical protein